MAIIVSEQTHYLIQGMTGREGQRTLKWIKSAGSSVLAGVTPGKGGQDIDGVPVFDSVSQALTQFPQINASCLYVPPKFVLSAAKEAIAAGVPLVHIFAEGVPSADTAVILELAYTAGVRVVGPSSIGILSPSKSAAGSVGGGDYGSFLAPDERGGVVVLSKSGGMVKTIANMLTRSNIPQSTIMGIGGDRLEGTTFADVLPNIAADDETKAVVVIGEFGGSYEEDLAAAIAELKFTKPVVAFISGLFAETLPQGISFGHAGAIVSRTVGTRQGKITALEAAGALVAQTPTDIPVILKEQLGW